MELVFDRLSVPFAILSFLLCGTVAAFATRYMHREQGYNRFFVLYAIFVLGMVFNTLYTIRGSIVPGIVAHAINNGVIFLVLSLLTAE